MEENHHSSTLQLQEETRGHRGGRRRGGPKTDAHRMEEAVLAVLLRVQHAVFDEHRDCPQDERHKQVHVDEVARAVQLPADRALSSAAPPMLLRQELYWGAALILSNLDILQRLSSTKNISPEPA